MYQDLKKKKALKEKYGDEQVFVIQPAHFSHLSQGYTAFDHKHSMFTYFSYLAENGSFVMRHDAEHNPCLLQIIPYLMVKKGDKFFAYKRLSASKEERLQNMLSLGFGGHINPCDFSNGNQGLILNGLQREMEEELQITLPKSPVFNRPVFKGIVKDESAQLVDHIGLVFLIEVEDAVVLETEKYEGIWFTKEELKKQYINFENWAKEIIAIMP